VLQNSSVCDSGTIVSTAEFLDGRANTLVTTGAAVNLADGYSTTLAYNNEATAGAAVTYTLPTAKAGLRKCVWNGSNAGTPDTGALTLQTSAAGQFIIFTDGTYSASDGYVISSGVAGDTACVAGVDATHWQLIIGNGSTWTKH
jgi:hypothetical protein